MASVLLSGLTEAAECRVGSLAERDCGDQPDRPGGTGTVFNLEDEDGNTTVIWVTPEDTVEGI